MKPKKTEVAGMTTKQAYMFIEHHNINDEIEFCQLRRDKGDGYIMSIEQAARLWRSAMEIYGDK